MSKDHFNFVAPESFSKVAEKVARGWGGGGSATYVWEPVPPSDEFVALGESPPSPPPVRSQTLATAALVRGP